MARRSRNRYREMESIMSKIILADVLVFILYLVCAGYAWHVLKVITAIIAIFGSLLCVGWLYLTGEVGRRRSLWILTAFVCIIPPFLIVRKYLGKFWTVTLRNLSENIAFFDLVCYDTCTRKRSWRDEKWLDAVVIVIVRWRAS